MGQYLVWSNTFFSLAKVKVKVDQNLRSWALTNDIQGPANSFKIHWRKQNLLSQYEIKSTPIWSLTVEVIHLLQMFLWICGYDIKTTFLCTFPWLSFGTLVLEWNSHFDMNLWELNLMEIGFMVIMVFIIFRQREKNARIREEHKWGIKSLTSLQAN